MAMYTYVSHVLPTSHIPHPQMGKSALISSIFMPFSRSLWRDLLLGLRHDALWRYSRL